MQCSKNCRSDINWSFPKHERTIELMEGLFLADKPDPNKKLRDVPHKPGVYLMKDRLKRVIYVGKARDLRKRLAQYFMPSRRMTADLKTRALLDSIWDFEVQPGPEESQVLAEAHADRLVPWLDDEIPLQQMAEEREELLDHSH